MREIGEGERERSIMRKIRLYQGFFVNVRHRGIMWHTTSAFDACVAYLEPGMNHLKDFRDPIRRFESLGT